MDTSLALVTHERASVDQNKLVNARSSDGLKALRRILGADVAIFTVGPGDYRANLKPEEAALVLNSAPGRQLDFAAGRYCAQRALRQLGAPPEPIVRRSSGAPLWPSGYTGSISHCPALRAAAVTLTTRIPALGIDIEPLEPMDGDVARLICGSNEKERFERMYPYLVGLIPTTIFSMKESFYKCYRETADAFLEFRDVEVRPRDDKPITNGGAYVARVINPTKPPATLYGSWTIHRGMIFSCARRSRSAGSAGDGSRAE